MSQLRSFFFLGCLIIVSCALLGCSSSSSSNLPPDQVGTQYFAVIPATSPTLKSFGVKIALTDVNGKDNWCAPPGSDLLKLVQQACQKNKFLPGNMCAQASALVANESTNLSIWGSDLAKGMNNCKGGTILEPGVPKTNCNPPGSTNCMSDILYTCLYTNDPPQPCPASPPTCDTNSLAPSPGLTCNSSGNWQDPPGAGGFANYIAMASGNAGPEVKVVSDKDSSKNGTLSLTPGRRAFSFDLDGMTMYVSSLNLPVDGFTFNDQFFAQGQATLVNPVHAEASPGSTSSYVISPGNAMFSLIALDPNGAGFAFSATNSTPLTIDLATSAGPHITGTLHGSLEGQPLHADLDVSMIWLNRPPVAIIRASNVTFNSSTWLGARDNKEVCLTPGGLKGWTWHGVPSAKVTVTLDGSSSYDPDPGDSLQYSWSGKAVGNQKTIYLDLSEGNYLAVLTVQDQYYVSTVNQVHFRVRDLADPGPPPGCGTQLEYPNSVIRYRYRGDPPPFWSVVRSYASSEGPGIAVNFHTREQVLKMAEPLSRLHLGETIYKQALSPNLGAPLRQ